MRVTSEPQSRQQQDRAQGSAPTAAQVKTGLARSLPAVPAVVVMLATAFLFALLVVPLLLAMALVTIALVAVPVTLGHDLAPVLTIQRLSQNIETHGRAEEPFEIVILASLHR